MVACVIGLPLSLVDLWCYLSGPRSTLIIDAAGVHDHLSRDLVGLIRWEEIEEFNVRTLNGWLKVGNNDSFWSTCVSRRRPWSACAPRCRRG